jgi:hypothetical protein
MGARRRAAPEGLDDDHAAAAAWARMRERRRFIGIDGVWIAGLGLRHGRIEQLTRPRDVLGTCGWRTGRSGGCAAPYRASGLVR